MKNIIKTTCLAFLVGIAGAGYCQDVTLTGSAGVVGSSGVTLDISGMENLGYGIYHDGIDPSNKLYKNFFWKVPVSSTEGILFPVKQLYENDCLQPNNYYAALWSCANVNDENVTKTYMKLFGVIPYNEKGDTLKLINTYQRDATGATITVSSRPVIQFCDNDFEKNGYYGYNSFLSQNFSTQYQLGLFDESMKCEFIKNFEKIASSPVGRVLLYRILIESLRQIDSKLFGKIFCDAKLTNRANGRGIIMARCVNDNCDHFLPSSYTYAAIGLSFKDKTDIEPVKLSVVNVDDCNIVVDDKNASADITLFHEMLHWFHSLQSVIRASQIRSGINPPSSYDYKVYYGDVPIDLLSWGNVRVEELMSIAGKPDYRVDAIRKILPHYALNELMSPNSSWFFVNNGFISGADAYIEGDDLSENAYRLMKKINGESVNMRWGHGSLKNIETLWNYSGQPQYYYDMMKRLKLADTSAKICVSSIINAGKKPGDVMSNVKGFLDD